VTVTDTSNTVVKPGDSSNNAIRVNVVAGGSSGVSQADRSTFTDGTTTFTPVGGVFNDSATAPSSGQAAAARITSKRAVHVNIRDNSGNELGIAAAPVRIDPTGTTTQPVSLATLPATENYLGFVGGKLAGITANFTRPNDTTAYAAGDAVTDSTSSPTKITFSNCARIANGTGRITGVHMVDSANQATKGVFELWVFDTSVTPDNDNSAFTPTDTECGTLVGIVPLNVVYVGDATSGAGGNAVYYSGEIDRPFTCTGSTRDLYGLMVVRNAYTPVAQEVFTFRLQIDQD
jgi:hypothetical protein